ncbi:MAG: hypothetical protein VKQ33_01070 [Candidatus Sericytochromatia bacterium]|nr:hypothetical protein [Candidatus Sericytochromatia bacterium]
MPHSVAKDPDFPLRHAQITDLKDTKRIAEEVKEADIVVIRNGETVGYFVNPEHYEALVEAAAEADARVTKRFLENYAKRHGGLERLEATMSDALRGDFASADDVDRVFGRP